MPAEWEPHQATWLAWPHHRDDWPGKFGAIPWVYVEIIRHLHKSEKVRLLVQGDRADQEARHALGLAGIDLSQIESFPFRTNRVWTRDSGPIFIKNRDGEIAVTDWRFNAWAKYPNWRQDDKLPRQIAHVLDLRSWQPRANGRRVVLEGGSIDVNGQGLLLTTEECLLSEVQQRNPGLARADLEKAFADYLGVKKVLWLNQGIAGDDTHGHVDDLARFVSTNHVVTVVEENPADENYKPLQENLERLRGMTDNEGQLLEIIPLPMPNPVYWEKIRLPASYANFYIANNCVLVPTFNDPKDRVALGILGELFPSRDVIGIHAVDLVWGLGTLHCMTQQQP
ncbi:MAG TPA: agmatine deiminase family protein [Gemmataceae bacterium]|nr:agmatine deiminase family protein [Gemmataceae bacterium]